MLGSKIPFFLIPGTPYPSISRLLSVFLTCFDPRSFDEPPFCSHNLVTPLVSRRCLFLFSTSFPQESKNGKRRIISSPNQTGLFLPSKRASLSICRTSPGPSSFSKEGFHCFPLQALKSLAAPKENKVKGLLCGLSDKQIFYQKIAEN